MDRSKIPDNFDKMVFSVPHSGTTSLVNHLGLHMGGSKSGFRHFGHIHAYHQAAIDEYRGQAHIPIRDPLHIALSWDERYDDEAHKWGALRDSLEAMIAYDRPGTVYWHTKDLPANKAKGPNHVQRFIKIHRKDKSLLYSPRVHELRKWYNGIPDVQLFYEQFFPEGFWWA